MITKDDFEYLRETIEAWYYLEYSAIENSGSTSSEYYKKSKEALCDSYHRNLSILDKLEESL